MEMSTFFVDSSVTEIRAELYCPIFKGCGTQMAQADGT